MRELVILVMYIWASISDMRNRTIPNRIPILLAISWPIWLAVNENCTELLMNALWSELFVTCVLVMVGIVTKFIGHVSSLGGGDIKLILSACLYLEIKETFVFLFSANILGVMFSFMFFIVCLLKFITLTTVFKSDLISTTSAASIATSVPVPIANPTFA